MTRENERSEFALRAGNPAPPVTRENERSEFALRAGNPAPPVKRAVGALALALLLTACASGGSEDAGGTPDGGYGLLASRVEVDTPELRRLRARAGMEPCRPGRGEPVEGGLPRVTLPCLGGGPAVDLARLRGPMVVNLWASWCGPCREELPYYQRLHAEAGDRVRVLGVAYEDTRPEEALRLAAETGVTYPSLADPSGELHEPLRVRGLPGIVFVDEDGRVVSMEYLVIESYPQLRKLVRERLGVDV